MKVPKLYPVVDRLNISDLEALGLKASEVKGPYPSLGMPANCVHAVYTGEQRPPRKGEWYLSGSIVEAYRAPNDLSTPYHIARLVRTETKTVTTIRMVETKEQRRRKDISEKRRALKGEVVAIRKLSPTEQR